MDLADHIASLRLAKSQSRLTRRGAVPRRASTADLVPAHVWSLISDTHGDPLAPFAMADGRRYWFSADATAALSFRLLDGYAVVGGDPIGNVERYSRLVSTFSELCASRHWHLAVLGVSEQRLPLWHNATGSDRRMSAIPIGRDVVIDVNRFSLAGRGKRNLRQAVQRTCNAGMTTQIVAENHLDDQLRADLYDVMLESGRAVGVDRGFSMMLGSTLSGRYPGVWLIIARDRAGRIQGFHRYASAGGGTDISLDLPWRRQTAPNGTDERLSIDMVRWVKEHGGQRVSLAFAPFPELFEDGPESGLPRHALRALAHIGDRFIKLESLYRYVRKFDALGQQRFALFPPLHFGHALSVLLTLEFSPRHRSVNPAVGRWNADVGLAELARALEITRETT
ncbi:bifunctional lysylphosphatidylglycerol flippase/synthetase MprF [Mycobacterium sp. PDNC021]|uniref:bifunctional lysylphosphatidylglycerol flippase/synthetase MprF n=1 Tax=Mycobacterium sp. PDNC021 TaxID=3391399 RepID=UPI003AAAB2AC